MSDDSLGATEVIRPYPPSWLDRLTAWVERLPVPASVVYAFAGLFAVAVFVLNDTLNGQGLLGGMHPFHVVLAVESFTRLLWCISSTGRPDGRWKACARCWIATKQVTRRCTPG